MRIFASLLLVLSLLVSNLGTVSAVSWSDLFGGDQPSLEFDCGSENCDIEGGINLVDDTINGVEQERTFTEYVQDVVLYLLTFISFIALIYIIYAGFMILTGAGDEEKLKKSKQTIFYVIIGIVLIWLAYPITTFIISALSAGE